MQFGKAIKDQWLLDSEIIFLNHGSFGACPKPVLEAQRRFQEQLEHEPVRFMTRELPVAIRTTQERLGAFVGSAPEDIVMMTNATMAVNAVLRSIAPNLKQGDELLTTSHVYGAVRKTMEYIASFTGAKVVEVDVPFPIADPEEVVEAVRNGITKRTTFALIDHITSPTGVIYPVEKIVPMLRERGIAVMIDGAHAPGMIDLHIEALGPDYYTGNCHKWLFAPKGAAFLWTRKPLQQATHPTVISHEYLQSYQLEFGWTGTQDPSAILSIGAGIDFFESLGGAKIAAYNRSMLLEAREKFAVGLNTQYGAPESMLSMLCTVPLPGNPSGTKAYTDSLHNKLFDEFGIEVPGMLVNGNAYIRFSAQVYNEPAEYEILLSALQGIFENGGVW